MLKSKIIALTLIAGVSTVQPLQAQDIAQAPTSTQAPLPSPERAQTLLFDAARLGRIDLIEGLIKLDADINATDDNGYTPLILASYAGHGDMVGALIDAGADPCRPDAVRGNTALMGVVFRGHDSIAGDLIATSCDVNATNALGQTALMMAALFGRDAQVDMLLAAGADPTIVDAQGNTAVSVALAQGNERVASRIRDTL